MSDRHSSGNGKRAPILDWEEARQRLERTRATVERQLRPDPEEQQRILRSRARELARESETELGPDSFLEVVEFRLAHETFALESVCVSAVLPLEDLTPVPCTPPFVVGIINVRGHIVSVIDLKRFFDLPTASLTDLNRVIIIHSDTMEFGVLADAVVGTRRVLLSELEPSLSTLTGVREEYFRGVTGDQTVILDARRLLADSAIVVHEEA